jgi:methionyl-tRNA formyltransferase
VDIAVVYTQPDRPAGRGRKPVPGPVKLAALAAGLPLEQPETLKDRATQERLREYAPDLLVVVAYGLILPRAVLAIPRLGCWNVHASLLPRWRGAAPIQRALAAGDRETGVCLMQMQTGLDTGPVIARQATPITLTDTGASLHDRLAQLGSNLLREALAALMRGELPAPVAQPLDGVSYAHKIEKSEAPLDWRRPALELGRQVRAFDPWPVAEATIAGEHLRVWAAQALPDGAQASPGTLVGAGNDGLDIATGDGILRITRVQRAGGKPISVRDYLNTRPELKKVCL